MDDGNTYYYQIATNDISESISTGPIRTDKRTISMLQLETNNHLLPSNHHPYQYNPIFINILLAMETDNLIIVFRQTRPIMHFEPDISAPIFNEPRITFFQKQPYSILIVYNDRVNTYNGFFIYPFTYAAFRLLLHDVDVFVVETEQEHCGSIVWNMSDPCFIFVLGNYRDQVYQ